MSSANVERRPNERDGSDANGGGPQGRALRRLSRSAWVPRSPRRRRAARRQPAARTTTRAPCSARPRHDLLLASGRAPDLAGVLGESHPGTTAVDQTGANDGTYEGRVNAGQPGSLTCDATTAVFTDPGEVAPGYVKLPTLDQSVTDFTIEGFGGPGAPASRGPPTTTGGCSAPAGHARLIVQPTLIYGDFFTGATASSYGVAHGVYESGRTNNTQGFGGTTSRWCEAAQRSRCTATASPSVPRLGLPTDAITLAGDMGRDPNGNYALEGTIDDVAMLQRGAFGRADPAGGLRTWRRGRSASTAAGHSASRASFHPRRSPSAGSISVTAGEPAPAALRGPRDVIDDEVADQQRRRSRAARRDGPAVRAGGGLVESRRQPAVAAAPQVRARDQVDGGDAIHRPLPATLGADRRPHVAQPDLRSTGRGAVSVSCSTTTSSAWTRAPPACRQRWAKSKSPPEARPPSKPSTRANHSARTSRFAVTAPPRRMIRCEVLPGAELDQRPHGRARREPR